MSTSLFKVEEHIIPCQHIREYPRAVKVDTPLRLAIKQYIPLDNLNPSPGSVTIIAAHANGIPKECYEPLWDELVKANGYKIKSIWIADCSHQGASGVLNERAQGDDPNWFDHSRDLLHMVNHFRDQITQPVVGVAHSFSCSQFVHLSIMHPRLLHALAFLEPMIQIEPPNPSGGRNPGRWTALRPDFWPSRADAEASIRKNPFYSIWDPKVVDRYIQFGLRPTPTALYPNSPSSAVTLTTTKAQESWTFLRFNASPHATDPNDPIEHLMGPDLAHGSKERVNNNPSYVTTCPWTCLAFEFLPYIRPSVLFVFGEKSHINPPSQREDTCQRTGTGLGGNGGMSAGRVQAEVIPGAFHSMPLEKVCDTASVVSRWLEKETERFHGEEEFYRKYDSGRSECDGVALSALYMKYMNGSSDPKRPAKSRL